MRVEQLTSGHRRAVMIFAGWGMDSRPFAGLALPGYDVYVAWGYDGELPDGSVLAGYDEAGIVAWSYGVAAAARFIAANPALPLTARVAVNGVLCPVDDLEGMPRALYEGTLANLSERGMYKFYRRMFGLADPFRAFQEAMPQRSIDDLRRELEAYGAMEEAEGVTSRLFDRVYFNPEDKIIPGESQRRCWEGHPGARPLPGDHMPDFGRLLRRTLRDKELVKTRFQGAADTYTEHAAPQRAIALRLTALWREAGMQPGGDIMEFGVGTGIYTAMYQPPARPRTLMLTDIAALRPGVTEEDAETAIMRQPEGTLDVITAASALQWLNSPEAFIRRCAGALRPGGLLVLSSFAEGHFPELLPYQSAPLPLPTAAEALAWAPEGMEPIIIEEDEMAIDFATPRELLTHLRLTGVNGLGGHGQGLRAMLGSDGPRRLTYRPLYMIYRKL